MQLPVTLRLKASSRLVVALAVAHGLAVAGLAATDLALVIKLPVCFALALSLAFGIHRHALRLPLLALTLKADGHLEIERRDGVCIEAHVHPGTTVFPWLVVLRLRLEGRVVALTLPPDAIEPEGHRQLRLWLRWQATA
ncbi:MAG: hypothetical protein A2045_04710 [Rhodocyclales bacterium GWA2_65_20]|nr:MAG: hypothetical protein A2045_04710 [Rhodocyclales bacterium GWA2_65_20]